jgi:sugar lactone lactonase YvrE
MGVDIESVSAIRCKVGESPVWDAAARRLYWVDIPACLIHALDVDDGRTTTWTMPSAIGSLGLCRDGRLVVALQHGVHVFDPATGGLQFLVDPEQGRPNQRLNDGKVGPDGAFWVGSMSMGITPPPADGVLYRVTGDGQVEPKVRGLLTSNGLAWSGDGRTLFHSDSRAQWIDRYAFDSTTGTLSDGTRIANPTMAEGRPDGAAVDVEGCYWSCGVSAGRLNRFSPEGDLLSSIALPVPAPTMPCFAGDDMQTLYVTSLQPAGSTDALSGALLRLRAPVAGVPVHRFAYPA